MYSIWPAGRALGALVVILSLTRPSAAYWYSKKCYLDALGMERCEGLSYGAGAGIGIAITMSVLFLIMVVAYVNRPHQADIEEVWVTQIHPAGIPASIPQYRQAPPPHQIFQPEPFPHIIGEASPSPRTTASQRPPYTPPYTRPLRGEPSQPNEKTHEAGDPQAWHDVPLKTPRTPRIFVSDAQGRTKQVEQQLC